MKSAKKKPNHKQSKKKPSLSLVSKTIKESVLETFTGELIIALCGPIGSPLHEVGSVIKRKIESEHGYDAEIIKLSDLIQKHTENVPKTPAYDHIQDLINKGNELRKKHNSGILAELSIREISEKRLKYYKEKGSSKHKPRKICHIIDSIKNKEELEILRLVYGDMLYFIGVFSPIEFRAKSLKKRSISVSNLYKLIDRDSGEEIQHGQSVRETFPLADFFLQVQSTGTSEIGKKIERFLRIIIQPDDAQLHHNITPTLSERAMYLAASAAVNSACLSRQVGACITDNAGNIISTGWNDVPRAGGNLYGHDNDEQDSTPDSGDRRCYNTGGNCSNDDRKKAISEEIGSDLIDKLIDQRIITNNKITKKRTSEVIKTVVDKSPLADLIEFSKAVHAEMHALITGVQNAGDRLVNGKLYCTVFPCHFCARHIVAAGIMEVYFIEPYPKSLALELHDDSYSENIKDDDKVTILPFEGVAPNRYLKLFKKKPGRKNKEELTVKSASNKVSLESIPVLEALIVKRLGEGI